MELIQRLSTIIGAVCIVIGLLLLPLGIWFMINGTKNKDKVSIVIAVFILLLAAATLYGAIYLFTNGLIQASPYMQ